jgi:GrpB-like predicted nucleotidyltransferase (UPF0157 family)
MPIQIAPYDPLWPVAFARERTAIVALCGERLRAIEHIGSTAVVGLAAKPIIDVAVAVDSVDEAQTPLVEALAAIGYEPFEAGMVGRLLFIRDTNGERTHHLHVLPLARWHDLKERLFRDWLREHPEDRDRYASLKRALAQRFSDMPSYTRAKTDLIQEIVDAARAARGLPSVPVWEDDERDPGTPAAVATFLELGDDVTKFPVTGQAP